MLNLRDSPFHPFQLCYARKRKMYSKRNLIAHKLALGAPTT